MEKDKLKLFVVLEEHMIGRYAYIIKEHGFKSHYLKNNNVELGVSLKNIINRIRHRKLLFNAYSELKNWIENELKKTDVNQIYLSNSEGYIAHNIILKLRNDFPEIEFVGLQHGIFDLSKPPKPIIRRTINGISHALIGFLPFGVGFGEKIVDKYMVYNEAYKNYLINEFGWEEKDLQIGWKFLKAELYSKKKTLKKEGRIALFLMQCLSKASLCSEGEERHLNLKTIKYLSKNFDTVLIKNHPACNQTNILELNQNNVREVGDLIEAFNLSTHAYSYTSTTLLEAEIFEIKTYAITSKLIKDDKSIYKLFSNVIDFDNEIDI